MLRTIRPANVALALLIGCVGLILLSTPVQAQQAANALDVFNQPIDRMQIYRHVMNVAPKMVRSQPNDHVHQIREQLKTVGTGSTLNKENLRFQTLEDTAQLYRHMVKSSVALGELYNCGKCDDTHLRFAGGVIVDEEGLVLTNHHVLREDKSSGNTVEGFVAMTHDGRCWAIEKVIAADARFDVALIQLQTNGEKLYAAPIARKQPEPMEKVRCISHPSGEFFVLSEGEVSRYSKTTRRNRGNDEYWMEVTAEYGGGSSGSGIFNSQGEVVGLASRIRPLWRRNDPSAEDDKNSAQSFVEMVLRRCVPLAGIQQCFQQ